MKIALVAIGLIALMGIGFVFVGGAPPLIIVAPEVVFHWGPVDVTNTMFTSWIAVIVLCLIGIIVGSRLNLVPSGFSGFVEAIIETFYNIVVSVAGEENGRRFFPLVATIFFFILFSNYTGLLPGFNTFGLTEPNHGDTQVVMEQADVPLLGSISFIPLTPDSRDVAGGEHAILPEGVEVEHDGAEEHAEGEEAAEEHPVDRSTDGSFTGVIAPYLRPVNTDITAPLAIAIFSFIFVEFWGLQSLGLGYLKKFFAVDALKKGPSGVIDIFVGLLELISELSRIVSFTFRLFGNMFAGEVLILMMTFLVPFVLINVFYGLELFVGLIQAFVFAMLTLVFAVTAVSHHGDEEHAGEHGGAH
jgi:F-type H+-transporting ATPase subunit a